MSGEVDLHVHSSKSSDGDFSPFHIIQLAKEAGLKAISITDHDTVAAYPEALQFGRESGVEVVPSVELTTIFKGREFHLLLPFVNWKKKVVREILTRVRENRIKEARDRISRLQEMDFDIRWKEVKQRTKSNPPLGVVIARIILEKAEKKGEKALEKYYKGQNRLFAPYIFYRDFFMEGKPAFVPKRNISLVEVLELIPQTEGVPVLAHPGAYFQQTDREDLLFLKKKGLEGLEVYTSYHESEQVKYYKIIAEELDLVATAGSDFHGSIKPYISFGSIKNGEYGMVEKLRERRK